MNELDFLKVLEESKGVNGVSLMDHLYKFLDKFVNEKSDFSNFEQLEILSDLVKKNFFICKDPRNSTEINNLINLNDQKNEFNKYLNKIQRLKQENLKISKLNTSISNISSESRMLQWAGVNFGEDETYKISKSIANLANKTKATELKFWGKILASKNDYYVAQGITPSKFADKMSENCEPKGKGVNLLTFWVTHSVLNDWFELPLITPDHILVSRLFKYIFTGNLEEKVLSYPEFPGLEKHLLKAQIVRITYSTTIAPRGLFKTNDDIASEIEYEEEFKFPEISELISPENWVHVYPQILKAGRIEHVVPENIPQDDKQEYLDNLLTNDPVKERLSLISEDNPYESHETNWLIKNLGELSVINLVDKEEGNSTSYSIVSLKNLSWPGSLTVAQNNIFCNFYVGYGFKAGQTSFFPLSPNDLVEDPEDYIEQPEPNPKDPIQEVESDSDEEKKDDDDNND